MRSARAWRVEKGRFFPIVVPTTVFISMEKLNTLYPNKKKETFRERRRRKKE
jgi:hypothetical protein